MLLADGMSSSAAEDRDGREKCGKQSETMAGR